MSWDSERKKEKEKSRKETVCSIKLSEVEYTFLGNKHNTKDKTLSATHLGNFLLLTRNAFKNDNVREVRPTGQRKVESAWIDGGCFNQ